MLDLVAHLVRSTLPPRVEPDRVVAEVVDYFTEPVPEARAAAAPRAGGAGLTNDGIFAASRRSCRSGRSPHPALSARQLRRIVYG